MDFEEQLDLQAGRRELLAIQLRLMSGVDIQEFERIHGALDVETYATLNRLQDEGLLECKGQIWKLSKRGVLFYDSVATDIV